jgi:hypothetical protein
MAPLIALLVFFAVASCAMGQEEDTPARKTGSGELRTDTEPLTKRFSALGGLRDVQWMSGVYGDPDNPGPSTYWIDAVITLDSDQQEELETDFAPEPTDDTPSVVAGMRPLLPPGPYRSSDQLDAAFKEDRWWASAYLDPQAGKLVLVATGT